jgi:hypothetical protein
MIFQCTAIPLAQFPLYGNNTLQPDDHWCWPQPGLLPCRGDHLPAVNFRR